MRRTALFLVAVLILSTALSAEAAAKRKGKKKKARSESGEFHRARNNITGPFADVPRGHWSYEAVSKAVESGILQGWENKFHGSKVVNRYQMAVVVARMLDRVGVLKSNGRVITPEDVANLEALTIEFADELALLNVKVNKLEDAIAAMRKDLDLVKAEMASGGVRAGISGTLQTRFAATGSGSAGWRPGPYVFNPVQPNPSATRPLARYRGGVSATPAGAPIAFSTRDFFTVSNAAINFDRQFDPHSHAHLQLEICSEGDADIPFGGPNADANFIANPNSGRAETFIDAFGNQSYVKLSEAYVVWEDWFTQNVNTRLGIFALPMNTEVNGPSRTYQWTITPSIANSKWESLRPVGLDVFRDTAKDELVFYVGFFTPGDSLNGTQRSGTLLSSPTPLAVTGLAQTDPLGGRFPTPLRGAAMTDAPRGVETQRLAANDIGFYGYAGTHPRENGKGLKWHVAYLGRNGNLRGALTDFLSLTDWSAWQIATGYRWHDVTLSGQYYDGTSKNYNFADNGLDARRGYTTPLVNPGAVDTRSYSASALVNWAFHQKGSVALRYEKAKDGTGSANLEADVVTIGFNWRTTGHSWLQAEFITSDSRSSSENNYKNTRDVDDDLFQVNYKLNW